MAFKRVKAGDWQQPIARGYRMACCDCGLVHRMDFRVFRGKVQMRAFRDGRSTARLRRSMRRPASPERPKDGDA